MTVMVAVLGGRVDASCSRYGAKRIRAVFMTAVLVPARDYTSGPIIMRT